MLFKVLRLRTCIMVVERSCRRVSREEHTPAAAVIWKKYLFISPVFFMCFIKKKVRVDVVLIPFTEFERCWPDQPLWDLPKLGFAAAISIRALIRRLSISQRLSCWMAFCTPAYPSPPGIWVEPEQSVTFMCTQALKLGGQLCNCNRTALRTQQLGAVKQTNAETGWQVTRYLFQINLQEKKTSSVLGDLNKLTGLYSLQEL